MRFRRIIYIPLIAAAVSAHAYAGGLVVSIGCEDVGRLAKLAEDGNIVHALSTDREAVEEARKQLMERGIYGQVVVDEWDGKALPYVDDLVNEIEIQSSELKVQSSELMRVLVPGGVFVSNCKLQIANCKSNVSGDLFLYQKRTPEEIDSWTHWLYGPENNAVSKDKRVGVSRSLQWHAPPSWSRHHNLPAGFNSFVTAGGRVYYMYDTAPNAVYGQGQWVLEARDAFNGLKLWSKDIDEWHMEAWGAPERYGTRIGRFHSAPDYQAPRRIVADGDRLFVTLGFSAPVSVLDGKTGEVVTEYADTKGAGEIIYQDGILYVARNILKPEPHKVIMAVDTGTGKPLWKNDDYKGLAPAVDYREKYGLALLTAGADNIFLVDAKDVVALDKKTGEAKWKRSLPVQDDTVGDINHRYGKFCTLVYHGGLLFLGQIHAGTGHLQRQWHMKKMQLEAIDAMTGKLKWDYTGGTLAHVTPPDLFIRDGKVWTLDPAQDGKKDPDIRMLGLDCGSGKIATTHTIKDIACAHHHRCYRNKATENYYIMGEEGVEYIDFDTGDLTMHYWLRGACRYGILPANGLVYIPPHNCSCFLGTLLHGMYALKSTPSVSEQHKQGERLYKGEGYEEHRTSNTERRTSNNRDWWTFRGDAGRSGSTSITLPEELAEKWKTKIDGKLTAPIIVGDKVFLASTDGCQVYCLDGKDGSVKWRFAADGPIDTPPTWSEGCLVFGTRAGSLYNLSADTGALVWRFRAGPARAYICAYGRLESPWPLNGNPLVVDGRVYCVAGRSMSLDGGIYFYKLDLKTGELLQETNLQSDMSSRGEAENNYLADVLVGDGKNLHMKSLKLSMKDISSHEFPEFERRGTAKTRNNVLRSPAGMIDDSWLNNCFWVYGDFIAQQMVFDDKAVFGIIGPTKVGWGGSYTHNVYKPGEGYRLYKWIQGKKYKRKNKGEWKNAKVNVRARSLLLTRDGLYLAGNPDETYIDAPWAAYEGKRGAKLLAVSRDDGEVTAEYDLAAEPVYNGMAAGEGCLILCLRNGSVVCFTN